MIRPSVPRDQGTYRGPNTPLHPHPHQGTRPGHPAGRGPQNTPINRRPHWEKQVQAQLITPSPTRHAQSSTPTTKRPNARTPKTIKRNQATHKEYFGDLRTAKSQHALRVDFENIHGIPHFSSDPRNQRLFQTMLDEDVDVKLMAETNVNWNRLQTGHHLKDRVKSYWRCSKTVTAHNTTCPWPQKYQPGGTAILCTEHTSYRCRTSGKDPLQLGRWCWTRLDGQKGQHTTIFSAYQPCALSARSGTSTVASQHKHFFNSTDVMDINVRKLFVSHLCDAIRPFIRQGDQVILGIDVNDNVKNCHLTTALEDLGLVQPILNRHGQKTPPTYLHGSRTIDTIYCTPGLHMTRGGYTEFDSSIGDHRCCWGDFTHVSVYGFTSPEIITHQRRRLKTEDPRVVKAYVKRYERHIACHNGLQRASRLEKECSVPLSPAQAHEFEALDDLHVKAACAAEAKCRKFRDGAHKYCDKYSQLSSELHLWELVCKRKTGRKTGKSAIHRYAARAKVQHPLQYSLRQAYQYWLAAKQRMARLKKEPNRRETWLESLAKAKEKTDRGSFDTIKRQLLTRERQRDQSRAVKSATKSYQSRLTHVEYEHPDGTVEMVTDKLGMETAIINQNRSEYQQCTNTPALQGQLLQDIGYLGLSEQSDRILDGTYNYPPELTPGSRKFLAHLKMPPQIKDGGILPNDISSKDYKAGWKKAKEKTSSGTSPLHFGHYKAGITSDALCQFEKALTNIPHKSGYSPSRWRRCIDVMLMKKDGVHLVDKLRTIVLLEPDFQALTKHMGRTCMNNALTHQVMCPENFGSVKGRNQVEAALVKRLFYDIARQRKSPVSLCSNDAKACYNRIAHAIMSLSFQRLGVPKPSILSTLQTMQQMVHQVRTPYGDSDQTHGYWDPQTSGDHPQQGAFQGIGNAPSGYASLSTAMNDTLRDEGYGIDITSALSKVTLRLASICFVDDDDQAENARYRGEAASDITARLQEAIDLWGECLRTTGGALSPGKSFWYLVDFLWNDDGTFTYAPLQHKSHVTLTMIEDGIRKEVERVDPSVGKRTLGIRLAPDGNHNDELNHLKEISGSWAKTISNKFLSQTDSWFALNISLVPKLTWHSAALTFSPSEWTSIYHPALKQGLRKSGIESNFTRDFLYAPLKYHGLGSKNPSVTSFLRQFNMIYKHSAEDSPVHQSIQISLDTLKIELGMPGSPFLLDYKTHQACAVTSYLKSLWQTSHHHNVELRDPGPHLPKHRIQDRFIMQELSKHFRPAKLARLNRCRLFLGVTSLSHISSADGQSILPGILRGYPSGHFDVPATWPHQGPLKPSMWIEWAAAIKSAFTSTTAQPALALTTPLGPWLDDSSLNWRYWYSPSTRQAYKLVSGGTTYLTSTPICPPHRPRAVDFDTAVQELPPDCVRATMSRPHGIPHIRCKLRRPRPPTNQGTQPASLWDTFLNLPTHLRWITTHFPLPADNALTLRQAMQSGTAIAVTDGSFQHSMSTASWTIQGLSAAGAWTGQLVTPGNSQDAYRAELSGLVALVVAASTIARHHAMRGGSITAACDNISAVRKAQTAHWYTLATESHFDMVKLLRESIMASPLQWSFQHVKGHQDDAQTPQKTGKRKTAKQPEAAKFIGPLDRWASLNVDMDNLAKLHLTRQHQLHLRDQLQDAHWDTKDSPHWTLSIHEQAVTNNLEDTVLDAIYGTKLTNYHISKGRLTEQSSTLIHWDALGGARSSMPLSKQIWISKHAANKCGVNKCLHQRGYTRHGEVVSATCPRCNVHPESSFHVVECNAAVSLPHWNKAFAKLRKDLHDLQTHPDIRSSLNANLRSYKQLPHPPTYLTDLDPLVQEATSDQADIGWTNLFFGMAATSWATAQQAYFKSIGSKKSGKLWLQRMIRLLLTLHHEIWEHRNDIVHHCPLKEQERRTRLEIQIKTEYHKGNLHLEKADRRLLTRSLETLLHDDLDMQDQWLAQITQARSHGKKQLRLNTYRASVQASTLAQERKRLAAERRQARADKKRRKEIQSAKEARSKARQQSLMLSWLRN